jgi:hypothetical protein
MCGALPVSPTQMHVRSNDVLVHDSGQQCQVSGLNSDTGGETPVKLSPVK